MTVSLAEISRPQKPAIDRTLAALGAVQSIAFQDVGSMGWGLYEVKFANGNTVWRINMAPDGRVSGLLFQGGP